MTFHLPRPVLLWVLLLFVFESGPVSGQESESKEQRDARMGWWREAKFGMFIHWGLYAQLAGSWNGKEIGGVGEWILQNGQIPVAEYKKTVGSFNPTDFNADDWVTTAKTAGMKYIIITAKHHEGFAMFKSADPFNIVDNTPFKRDPLMELAKACKKQGIKLGFYYSQDQDWTTPGGGAMRGHWDKDQDGDFAQYFRSKAIPQVKELLSNYPDAPAVLWFDTPSRNMAPELAGEMLAVLRGHTELIWNNRLGGGDKGDTETPEQHIPPTGYPGRDWETCMTINGTWGFKEKDINWKSTETLLRNLIDIVSKGGNYLLNVGPTSQGIIPAPEVERLQAVGAWLKVNGEAVYGTQAGPFAKGLSWGRATRKGRTLYLHVFDWPKDGKLTVPITNPVRSVWLLADKKVAITVTSTDRGAVLTVPMHAPDAIASVIVVEVAGDVIPLPAPPLVQAKDGSVVLSADSAELVNAEGKAVTAKIEEKDSRSNIGYWTNASDSAEWKVEIKAAGKFRVEIEYAAPGEAGFVLQSGPAFLKRALPGTGGWKNFTRWDAGLLEIPKAGVSTLVFKQDLGKGPFCNLRSISLLPEK